MERLKLGELLVRAGYITPDQLDMALATASAEGVKVGSMLLKLGLIDPDTLARALAKQRSAVAVRHADLERIDPAVIPLVPAHLAHKHRAVPVHMTAPGSPHNALLVAFVDPTALTAVDEIAFAANMRLEVGIAPDALIGEALDRIYPQPQARNVQMVDLDPTAVGAIATPEWAASWLRETKAVLELHEDGCVLLVKHDEWKALLVRRRAVLELVEEYIARSYDLTRQLTIRSKQDRHLISHFWRRGFMHQKDASHHTPPGIQAGRIDEAFLSTIQAWTDGRISSRVERVPIPRPASNPPIAAHPRTPSAPGRRIPPPRSGSVPPTLQVITGDILKPPPPPVTVEPVLLLTKKKQVNGQAPAPQDDESALEEIQILGDAFDPTPAPLPRVARPVAGPATDQVQARAPETVPLPGPGPVSVSAPVHESAPAHESVPVPLPGPVSASVSASVSAPVHESVPVPLPGPGPGPVSASVSASVSDPVPESVPAPDPVPVSGPDPASASAPPPVPTPAPTLDAVLQTIGAAKTSDDIGASIIDYLKTFSAAVLVLVVKDGMALGWKGHAPKADRDVIESVIWPLSSPMIAEAYEQAKLFRGPPPEDGAIGQRLWKMLHVDPPAEIAVAPIELKGRIVNLVYAHPPAGGSLPADLGEILARIAKAAGDRYLALLAQKRREH